MYSTIGALSHKFDEQLNRVTWTGDNATAMLLPREVDFVTSVMFPKRLRNERNDVFCKYKETLSSWRIVLYIELVGACRIASQRDDSPRPVGPLSTESCTWIRAARTNDAPAAHNSDVGKALLFVLDTDRATSSTMPEELNASNATQIALPYERLDDELPCMLTLLS